jgi:ribosomal protein S18 acetylase RimI-like enzyme/predicted GNAT family acetyltransferase
MNYQTQPLSTLSMQETADFFNRSFEDYFMPVNFTVDSFVVFAQRDGIDFDASQVLMGDNHPIGLALIACRGKASRMGGFGIVKKLRNQGAGSWFVKRLLDQARQRGETHMFLEVITQNQAGVRLYEKYGFTRVRKLLGFKAEKPAGIADEKLQECNQALVLDMSRGYCLPDLPWQLDAVTLGSVPSFGYRLENAFTLISNPEADHIAFRSLVVPAQARGQGQATRLLEALFARIPGKVWQVPAIFPEEMGNTFLQAGMQPEKLSQWQMVCRL